MWPSFKQETEDWDLSDMSVIIDWDLSDMSVIADWDLSDMSVIIYWDLSDMSVIIDWDLSDTSVLGDEHSLLWASLSSLRSTLSAAPAGVSELALGSLADCSGLKLTWVPPAGVWERYRVLLLKGSEVMVNTTVEKTARELSLSDLGLGPGSADRVAVIVESGDLATAKYCDGTGGRNLLVWTYSLCRMWLIFLHIHSTLSTKHCNDSFLHLLCLYCE